MSATAVISIMCRDRISLVADLTEAIIALGGDIFDMNAIVLGEGGIMYVAFSVWPDEPPIPEIEKGILALPRIQNADVKVSTFSFLPYSKRSLEKGTHRIRCSRRNDNLDDLGVLYSTFANFKASLIRVHSERYLTGDGWENTITMEVKIPDIKVEPCLQALEDQASALGFICDWEARTGVA